MPYWRSPGETKWLHSLLLLPTGHDYPLKTVMKSEISCLRSWRNMIWSYRSMMVDWQGSRKMKIPNPKTSARSTVTSLRTTGAFFCGLEGSNSRSTGPRPSRLVESTEETEPFLSLKKLLCSECIFASRQSTLHEARNTCPGNPGRHKSHSLKRLPGEVISSHSLKRRMSSRRGGCALDVY